MLDGLILLALVITLIFVAGLYGRLADVPANVRRLVQDEIDKARAADDSKAHKALQQAAAKQAALLLSGIRLYHDELAAQIRREVAAADVRARAGHER